MCAQVFAWTLAYSGVEVVRWTSSWLIVQHHKMTQPGNVKKLALQQWMLASSGVEVARWTTVVLDLLRQWSHIVANPALDDCFFWGGGCSMDDSGSGLATAMVAFLVANPTMDVCFFWGGG